MKRVLVRPTFHDWCQNQLFERGTSFNGTYLGAFRAWRREAERRGFRVDTWDLAPLEEADVLWLLDLPGSRGEFNRIRARLKPECKLVLQILESPVLSLLSFHPSNQKEFDAVLRYDIAEELPRNHFHYRLPNTLKKTEEPWIPFHERKGLVMVNSNRVEGIWAHRQKGFHGIPAIGPMFSGWTCGLLTLAERVRQERYSYRRRLARAAEDGFQEFVDLYGRGWNGERISWAPFYPNRPYLCAQGKRDQGKTSLCSEYRFAAAIENYQGDRGYISEKIFDAFLSSVVPVYLGDERISDIIPEESFVDTRRFTSPRDLLTHLRSMTEAEWTQKLHAGSEFVESQQAQSFSDGSFVESAMKTLLHVSE